MNATLEATDMLAELNASPEPVKKNGRQVDVPVLYAQHLLDACKRLPIATAQMHDLDIELKGIKKDLADAAMPFQLAESMKRRVHIASVKVNDISVQCRPPHHTTAIKDKKRINEVAAQFGTQFPMFFRTVRMIPETPAVVAALKAAGIEYCCHIAPLRALHEARSTDADVARRLLDIPEIKPVWAVLAGKDA